AEIKARPVPDIVVVGHTDRVGLVADNDRLALRRAESFKKRLIQQGQPEDSIQTAGRGEREPLIATPDETPEPRNRRIEILVR
ncbi:MAG TPA: OmpA family protein, partial [Accumulibacter sp.]